MKPASMQHDIQVVDDLWRRDKLDDVIQKLDTSDVLGSVKKVRKEILRLLIGLLAIPDVDKKLEDAEANQRDPAKALLASARKHNATGFVEKLRELLPKDEQVRKALGLDIAAIPKRCDATEGKIDNVFNRIFQSPRLNLKNRRVYVEIAFLRDDDVLLRTEMELDDLIGTSASLIQALQSTLEFLKDNAGGVTPRIEYDRCEHFLKDLRSRTAKIPGLLGEFKAGGSKKKSRTRRPKKSKAGSKSRPSPKS